MANHFNDLLLQTLKEMGLRLDRVENRLERVADRLDRVIEQKANKTDVSKVIEKLDQKADKSANPRHL